MKWDVVGKLSNGNPFSSFGLEWCTRCRTEVDTDTEAHHRHDIYTYKRWCLRCGKVLKYGVYRAPILSDAPLPQSAFEWVTRPEQDRR